MDEYYWFCMEHVRAYNLNWNAFAAGAEQDLAAQMASDKVWNRDTKPFRRSVEEQAWARLGISDAHEVLGQNATRNPGRATTGTRKLPPTERKAIEILDVRDTATKTEVRKAYKALIKVLHPDMNGGDRSDEERLQEVVWAWDQIKDSRNFRD
jgi:DnaJ-domain-containing protein 1